MIKYLHSYHGIDVPYSRAYSVLGQVISNAIQSMVQEPLGPSRPFQGLYKVKTNFRIMLRSNTSVFIMLAFVLII